MLFPANQQLDWQNDQIRKSRQNRRGPGGGCGLQADHCSCPVSLVIHLDCLFVYCVLCVLARNTGVSQTYLVYYLYHLYIYHLYT